MINKMAKSLSTTLQEAKRKIKETRKSLEDIARIGDQSLRVDRSELLKSLSNQTFDNLKTIPDYLSRLSTSKGYKDAHEKLLNDFKGLVNDYSYLKKQYNL